MVAIRIGEPTTLLSADRTDSIGVLREDLTAAEAACTCGVENFAEARHSLDWMSDLVNYSIQLPSKGSLPPGAQPD